MRPGVIPADVDMLVGSVLHGQKQAVVALVPSVDNRSESADLGSECGIQKAQGAAVLSIADRRTRRARSYLERCDPAVKEAGAGGIAVPGNVDRHIQWFGSLKVRDLRSDIAHREKRARHHLTLNTQVPRLIIRWREIGITDQIFAERNKRHILIDRHRKRIPAGDTSPRIVQTAGRGNHSRQ